MTFEECLLVLGLEKAYTDEQLKNAYRHSALVWHPDRFQNPSEELKKRAVREMQRVNEAFESLKSNRYTHSQAYTSSSAQPTPPPKASTPPRPSAPPQRTTPPPYVYNSSNTSAPAPSEQGTSGSFRRKGDKNFSTTIVLSVFLGLVGVDRFYLGYFWSGLFKALTYGGLGIMVVIDWYRIFTKKLGPRKGNYYGTAKPAIYIIVSLIVLGVIFKALGLTH